MKPAVAVFVTFVLSVVLPWGAFAIPAPDPGKAIIPPCSYSTLPLYSASKNDSNVLDHYFTVDRGFVDSLVSQQNYTADGILAYVYGNPQVPNATLLYFVYNPDLSDHYLTTSLDKVQNSAAQGYQLLGDVGNIYETPECNSVPVYELFYPLEPDHLYTTNEQDRTAALQRGYVDQDIIGYAFPPTTVFGSTVSKSATVALTPSILLVSSFWLLGTIYGEARRMI